MSYAIGIDLGGTRIKAVRVTLNGETLGRETIVYDPDKRMDWAERIREITHQFTEEAGSDPEAIGLSAPGLSNHESRGIAHMPGRLDGLEGLDWTEYLGRSKPVRVLNDAHAALLGEVWRGAARGYQSVILLTLGTGVGGAALVNGKLLGGAIGRGGHFGHATVDYQGPPDICNMPGSLEVAMGNATVPQRSHGRFESTRHLVEAFEAGDAAAERIWLDSVKRLACAIASFINIIDPEAVILGGGIAEAGKSLFEPLERFRAEMEWRPGGHCGPILPAQLGDVAGAYGAAYNALHP